MDSVKPKEGFQSLARWIALFLPLLLLHACTAEPQSAAPAARQTLRAIVLERLDGGLLVRPEEGSPELRSSDQIFVPSGGAELLDELGNAIRLEDFQAGDRVLAVYDGTIQETYPAVLAKCYEIRRASQEGDAAQAKE